MADLQPALRGRRHDLRETECCSDASEKPPAIHPEMHLTASLLIAYCTTLLASQCTEEL
jgi:hypothetical protein